MQISIQRDCGGIDWNELAAVIGEAGLAPHPPQVFRTAFQNSYAVVFVSDGQRLVGCGRSLSDGVFQTALYDVALLPQYQGLGLGRKILQELLQNLPDCNVILYASPGKELFYEHFGFRRLKTGMGLFTNAKAMQEKGMLE